MTTPENPFSQTVAMIEQDLESGVIPRRWLRGNYVEIMLNTAERIGCEEVAVSSDGEICARILFIHENVFEEQLSDPEIRAKLGLAESSSDDSA